MRLDSTKPEKRAYLARLTIETRADAGEKLIRGHAALFDTLSENLGGFREQVAKGAFAGVLDDDVRALFNHDPNHILGRTNAGTLSIAVDDTGLRYEIQPPDTQTARDLVTSIDRGDIDQSSFAFTVAEDDWEENEDGVWIRTILKVRRLYDVSPVTYPAYPDASVGLRSLDHWKKEHPPVGYSQRRRLLRIAELA